MTTDTVNGSPSGVSALQRLAMVTGLVLVTVSLTQLVESLRVNSTMLVVAWASYVMWWIVATRPHTLMSTHRGEKIWAWINLGLAALLLFLAIVSPDISLGWPDGIVWPLWMWVVVAVAAALAVLAVLNSPVDWLAAFAVAAVAVLLIWAGTWFFGVGDDFDGVIGGNGSGTAVVEHEDASALNISCDDMATTNGPPFIARSANLVFPASGPSMENMTAPEVTTEFCRRMRVDQTWRAFVPGALVPDKVLYAGSSAPRLLDKWPDALAESDQLSADVFRRLSAVAFNFEWVSQDALGGEDYKILTILPAEGEDRPVIATASFKMPTGGMSLWKVTPVAYGDSPLNDVSASFFEPTLGIWFIPSGVDLGVGQLGNEIDLGQLFGNEEAAKEAQAAVETTTSVANGTVTSTSTAPDGTVTTTSTATDGTVTSTVTTPDGIVTTTVTTPDGGSSTTVTTPGGGTSTTVTTPSGCGNDCGGATTTSAPCTTNCGGETTTTQVTTTTCPSCTTTTTTTQQPTTTTTTAPPATTTTTAPPATTTTTTVPVTTTTQPPTTTTTQPPTTTTTTAPPVQPDFKPQLVGDGPWTFQLALGNASDWCEFATQDGKVIHLGSSISEGDLYTHSNGDKWLWVTGVPCNGTPSVNHKTNTVVFGY